MVYRLFIKYHIFFFNSQDGYKEVQKTTAKAIAEVLGSRLRICVDIEVNLALALGLPVSNVHLDSDFQELGGSTLVTKSSVIS